MTQKSDSGVFWQIVRAPKDLIAGATYPFQALVLLTRSPALLRCVIFPILVNLVLGVALYLGLLVPGWNWINQWGTDLPTETGQWVATLPNWLNRILFWLPSSAAVIDDLLRWVLAIALFLTLGLALVQFGAIFGAPWYGNLAEQVERYRLGQLPTTGTMSLQRALEDIGRAIAFQLKKLLLLAGIGLPLLLVNFLPPFGSLVSSIGGIALAATLVALDFLDPPLERRRFSFRKKLSLIGLSLPASASFGVISLWLVSVPLLNLVTVPICLVAGTLLCCDYTLPKLPEEVKGGE